MTLSIYLKIPFKKIVKDEEESWQIRMNKKQDENVRRDLGYRKKNLSSLFDLM